MSGNAENLNSFCVFLLQKIYGWMKKNNGWIKLYVSILRNKIYKKPKHFHLWITLLLLANYQEHNYFFNGKEIKFLPGEFVTGRLKLKKITGIAETTIEDILNWLEKKHYIRQQKCSKYRVITIVNWKIYQGSDM